MSPETMKRKRESLRAKRPIVLPDFNQIWTFLIDFNKTLRYIIDRNPPSGRTERHIDIRKADMRTVAGTLRNY
jgi:hypothetical protein